jgi:hypothetical protein
VLLAIALLAAVSACAGCASSRPAPGRAVGTIEERAGAYRGIHLGMRSETVAVLLGAPLPRHDDPYVDPRAVPPFLPADTPADFVYPDLDLTFVGDRVASMTVFGQGAATTRGASIGSSLKEVPALYGHARCRPGRGGTQPEDPGCQVAVAPGRYLYFSGDPISLISISTMPEIP